MMQPIRVAPSWLLSFLCLLVLSPLLNHAVQAVDLKVEQFYAMATRGEVNVIVDVRNRDEWDTGHIENATLAANLGGILSSTPTADINATLQSMGILPCLNCPTVSKSSLELPS
jgi:hypothetical protein